MHLSSINCMPRSNMTFKSLNVSRDMGPKLYYDVVTNPKVRDYARELHEVDEDLEVRTGYRRDTEGHPIPTLNMYTQLRNSNIRTKVFSEDIAGGNVLDRFNAENCKRRSHLEYKWQCNSPADMQKEADYILNLFNESLPKTSA